MVKRLLLCIIAVVSSLTVRSQNIDFVDANVKALCVANWDTNEDGELSMEEAAAVTNLGNVFRNNQEITSFEEFEFFLGLKNLGDNSFWECSNLHSIKIPNNVKSIGRAAFHCCGNLTDLILPNGLTYIGREAFSSCENLAELNLPNSLTYIGCLAFCSCKRLTAVSIPGNVNKIEAEAFMNCINIESLTISDGVETIGPGAFAGMEKLKSIYIPKSVTKIYYSSYVDGTDYSARNPFSYCRSLETITVDEDNTNYESKNNSIIEKSTNTLVTASINTSIPSGTKIIGNNAFYGLPIEIMQIPSGITHIGISAFSNCENLKSIVIPEGVIKIDEYAFGYCPKLENVTLPSSLKEIGKTAFFTNSNYLKSIVIPEGVTKIGSNAFGCCYALEFVSLPSSLNVLLESTFTNCNNLTVVEANMTSPVYTSQYAFPNRANATLYVPVGSKDTYEAADNWKEFANIIEVGYIGNVNSELTGQTDIACIVVNRPGKLEKLYSQAGKPLKIKIIGEIDSNDLRSLSKSGYDDIYYPYYVDLSEANINASMGYPDNYLDSDWMFCSSYYNDDTGLRGPSTIVLPMSLQEYIGRAINLYSEQTTPFKTTIRRDDITYISGWCRFYVPSGTRLRWIEQSTYPDNVQFVDGPSKAIKVNTAGELATLLTYDEIETVNELTITGCINAKDFAVLKQMRNLVKLLMYDVSIEAYTGNNGPVVGQTEYQAGEVPAYVFQNNKNLQYITLPDNAIIGDYAFDGCTSLTTLYCKNVISLGDFCFRNTKIRGVVIRGANYTIRSNYLVEDEQGVNPYYKEFYHIGLNPFFGVSLRNAYHYTDIADENEDADGNADWKEYDLKYFNLIRGNYYESPYIGVTDKSKSILYAFSSLYSPKLPNSITKLADYAISGTELTSLDLNAVTTIGDGFLYQCPNLKSIACDNSQFKAVDGVLYSADMTTLVKYPCASDENEYVIPATVTQISKWAFEGAGNLNTIRIEANTPPTLGEKVFEDVDLANATLYVPYGTKTAYEAAAEWTDFGNILEMAAPDIPLVNGNLYVDAPEGAVTIYQGKTAKVSLGLDNEETLIAFEFYLQMPEGICIATDENGYPDVKLNSERFNHHTLEVTDDGNGLYHFLCYSNNNDYLKGNSGELMNFDVICDKTKTAGNYLATINNIKFSDCDKNLLILANTDFDIIVNSMVMGDVNDDGDIDVMDVVMMVSYIMGRSPSSFNFTAADHTGDGLVDVMDLVRQVSLVMAQSTTYSASNHIFDDFGNGLALVPNHDGSISMNINDGSQYVATQFVVSLSEGQDLKGVTTDKSHTVNIQPLPNNRYFVISYSASNAAYSANNRKLTLDVTGQGSVTVRDVTFVDIYDQKVSFQNVTTETVGIKEVSTNLTSPTDIYSTSGMLVKKDAITTDALHNGMYIINGKKYIKK